MSSGSSAGVLAFVPVVAGGYLVLETTRVWWRKFNELPPLDDLSARWFHSPLIRTEPPYLAPVVFADPVRVS